MVITRKENTKSTGENARKLKICEINLCENVWRRGEKKRRTKKERNGNKKKKMKKPSTHLPTISCACAYGTKIDESFA